MWADDGAALPWSGTVLLPCGRCHPLPMQSEAACTTLQQKGTSSPKLFKAQVCLNTAPLCRLPESYAVWMGHILSPEEVQARGGRSGHAHSSDCVQQLQRQAPTTACPPRKLDGRFPSCGRQRHNAWVMRHALPSLAAAQPADSRPRIS